MSISARQSVKCPKCGNISDITVWNSITVGNSEDLKEDLLKGRVNIFRCPECGVTGLMPTPLLYHDEAKKLMISFSPCNDAESAHRLFDKIRKSSKESGELKNTEGYNLRFVTDYNALLEKILIFDKDMNDKAIEVIKLMILSQDTEKASQRTCRFGKLNDGALEFMIHDRVENQVYTSTVPAESYASVWKTLRESGVKPYSFDWEIVNEDYAARLMNGFNN